MVTRVIRFAVLIACAAAFAACSGPSTSDGSRLDVPPLSDADYAWIAERIYQNETGGDADKLVHWNAGEDFPSFGIGHFIWFPAGVDAPFDESFPAMVAAVRAATEERIAYPKWLAELEPFDAPWPTREAFYADIESSDTQSLRAWLDATRSAQARHIVANFESRWNALEGTATGNGTLTDLLERLQTTPAGLFATIDYVNFKGIGTNPRERYDGHGWGLLQVLGDTLAATEPTADPEVLLDAFATAAAARLVRRAELAPAERNELRWVPGWTRRVDDYRRASP